MRLRVIDRERVERDAEVDESGTLMEALRELDYVAAICGGMCSCATCHVYVDPACGETLSAPQSDETELLAQLQHQTAQSRLACQIPLNPALDGLRVTLAPEE